MTGSKYYWIKLRTDFFNQETIDFLLAQQNGCQYVVLYQMLCLSTANTNGELITDLGEVIIPYDINKIVRDTKHFDFDTVAVALDLFKKLGLIYEEENGNLRITEVERLIGSESATREAIKKRNQRLKKKIEQGTQKGTNCLIENRYKILDKKEEIYKEEKEDIFSLIEDFKSNLTPTDYEMINEAIDKYTLEQFKEAIEISKSNNAKTIKYLLQVLKNPIRKTKGIHPEWMDKDLTFKDVRLTDEEQRELDEIIKGS